jgi:foldase protein PrsA
MRRIFPAFLAFSLLLASACGGGSSSSSNTSVPKDGVAIVGDKTITVAQLDHGIEQRIAAAKVSKQQLPKAGTQAYRDQVVQPLVDRLVFNAQVENIAEKLGVSVSDSDVQKALDDAITQQYKGDRAAFKKDLEKYKFTETDVRNQVIRPSLLQKKIQEKIQKDVKITDKDVQDYYNKNKAQYASQDSREVDFLLVASRNDAIAARAQLLKDTKWSAVAKKYAIAPGPPSTGGKFTATNQQGALEDNFRNAVFGNLGTGTLSALIPVSDAYMKSSLPGKCKPQCFFLIKPLTDVKAGKQQTFDEVKAQIRTQLEQTQLAKMVDTRIKKLLDEQKKQTHYAAKYKPAATNTAGSGSTTTP